jgi:hypothetical protein
VSPSASCTPHSADPQLLGHPIGVGTARGTFEDRAFWDSPAAPTAESRSPNRSRAERYGRKLTADAPMMGARPPPASRRPTRRSCPPRTRRSPTRPRSASRRGHPGATTPD